MKRTFTKCPSSYVRASATLNDDDDIVYTTASGRGKVRKFDYPNGDIVYDATILDRYGDECDGEEYDTLDEAISFVDEYEAKYQWGLSKQPEFEKWYQSLSPEVKEDFDRQNSWNMSRCDISCDYESMLDYIDYVKSGRKPKWARSMNLSDKEFHDMTNYSGLL